MDWTKEQNQAIIEKGSNILVAAAAGSGKTAVLVERIINKVVNEKIDIDKILVVTFTNAAASEMRERILDAIYKKLEENPEDSNLQRQITLLNKANICTIHSFCLDVIRNNFYEIDTSANFRIGDTAEIELLKNEVIEDLFEQKYSEQDKGFLKLIDTYTGYRGDEPLVELILNIYKYIQSNPFPEKWLEEKVEMFNIKDNKDFSETIWGKILLDSLKDTITECIMKLNKINSDLKRYDELEKYSIVLEDDINGLMQIYDHTDSWDETYQKMNQMEWKKWPVDKKVTIDLKNEAKEMRDKIKKQFNSIEMSVNSKEALQDISEMYEVLKELQKIVQEFGKAFAEKKKEKNIIDFNDIEHFALKILVNEKDGKIEETEVAGRYREKFAEIAIDEYQDSNLVQEYILNSISNKKNIFMVGDVKQSIYKFRQARPELFLEKYANYKLKNEIENTNEFTYKDQEVNGQKIKLFKNFRSRKGVLDFTNLVFENIMSRDLGDVEYDQEEYLNYGANYPCPEEKDANFAGIAELNIINLKEEETDIYKDTSDSDTLETMQEETDEEKDEERIENSVIEARFVANKIKELLNSNYLVFDRKEGYRKITYKDICVLLRATSITAPIYEKEISELDLPVFSDTSSTYLDSMEVQTIMALLKIINNPMQDIPLVTVLRSNIGKFDDNELIQIRLADKNHTFYESMLKARLIVEEPLKRKIETLLDNLEKWRNEEQYLGLDELIWKIYMDTGFYHYVSLLTNGNLRQANLKMLFEKAKQYEKASFKGLFNFINFMEKVKLSNGDLGAAKLIGENDNVIRIMSIHKSKGLEFPVVFLCGTGRKINMQDLNKPILLHQDIGFGPKLINPEKRVEYNTLAKEAIKIKSKKETISEEMRILYVALTRAKEKLIITGISKDLRRSFKEKEQLLSIYCTNEEKSSNQLGVNKVDKIDHKLLEKYTSYLDWLELVYLYNKDKIEEVIQLKEYRKNDILEIKTEKSETTAIEELLQEKNKEDDKKALREKIAKRLSWKYDHIESSKIPTKTSVTKLKQSEEQNDISLTYTPKFIEKNQKLTSAQKGTVMHLCIQKLDEGKDYKKEEIKEFAKNLYKNGIISELELESIDIQVLYEYTQSTLWKELKQAKKICKEQPFYINIPAKEIYENADQEKMLVQGIIDLYYIDKNDRLILVDYKTDHIKKGDEKKLEEKYKLQLDLYKQALENALGRKVDKVMIYSLS